LVESSQVSEVASQRLVAVGFQRRTGGAPKVKVAEASSATAKQVNRRMITRAKGFMQISC